MSRARSVRTDDFGDLRPDYHQLVIFLKVVERRSFSAAARCLNRTQPAISQAIMRLEEICGANLFQRQRGAPLNLSPVGEAIVGSARTIVDTMNRQMADAASTARGRRGTLTLGFSGSLTAKPLQLGIAAFVEECPDAELHLIEGALATLEQQLVSNGVDLVVAPRISKPCYEYLTRELLWKEQLVAVLPADHELSRRLTIQWADFANLNLILQDSQTANFASDGCLPGHGVKQDIRVHRISRAALLDVVGLGIGVTIIPRSEITLRQDVVFRPIDEIDAVVSFEAAWLIDDSKPLRHKFLNYIRQYS